MDEKHDMEQRRQEQRKQAFKPSSLCSPGFTEIDDLHLTLDQALMAISMNLMSAVRLTDWMLKRHRDQITPKMSGVLLVRAENWETASEDIDKARAGL